MFDLGFFELLVILAIAFIVLKPQDFLRIAHKIGSLLKTLRDLQKSVKKTYQPMLDEMELKDVTKNAQEKAAKKQPLTHMDSHDKKR